MTHRIIGLVALSLGLAGCGMYYPPEGPPLPPEVPEPPLPPDDGMCDADGVQYYVGNYASREVGEAILRESGAETLRWGPPGSAWTMDYRPERVNVRYNKARKIIEITCG